MLESPIIRMGLIEGSLQLSYLLLPWSCLWERVVSLIGVFSGLSCIDVSSCLCTVGCGATGLARCQSLWVSRLLWQGLSRICLFHFLVLVCSS